MFYNVFQQLEEISNAAGRNDKIVLVKKYLNDPVFKGVIVRALSSDTVYHIKKLPPFITGINKDRDIFAILDKLNEQDGASSQDKTLLAAAASVNYETYQVVKRIVNKDLKCGIQAKSVNKAIPGTIYYVPYCRCETDKDGKEEKYWKKKGRKYAQLKENGMFFNFFHSEEGSVFITRNGKRIHQLDKLLKRLDQVPATNNVYMGEMLIVHAGVVMDRQTGNGILNKLIHGTAPQHEADCVAIRIWDAIPIKDFWEYRCDLPYDTRRAMTQQFIKDVGDTILVNEVYTEEIASQEMADDFYRRMRLQNEEGAVLKNGNAPWVDHTSPDQIKKKNTSSCALRLTGWKYGSEDSKYEDVMGALFFESECGKLKVTVNGKTDEMRAYNWDNMIGSIWTVLFESISYAKNKITASLYLPRIDKPRPDRTTADTLKEIIAREQAKKE